VTVFVEGVELDARSPWFPLAVAAELARGRTPGPDNPCMPHFGHWVAWHHDFTLKGRGFKPINDAQVAAYFGAPQ
jgi:hypothetical protein